MHTLRLLRRLLLPLAWLHAGVLRIRHALYDRGWLRSSTPEVPTIVVGNIALGGTGKTPHVELILRTLLSADSQGPVPSLAVLSRGYGRRGTGFREVGPDDDASAVGDEPLMLKKNFSGVHIFVGADRVAAVHAIRKQVPDLRALVLDDALQHRRIQGSLNLVLTTWQRPWYRDHLLPVGSLRDIPFRAHQAQVVIVTKCPMVPSTAEQARYRQRLRLHADQALFFSGLEYAAPRGLNPAGKAVPLAPTTAVLLITGIANPAPLEAHVRQMFGTVRHLAFADHHRFTTTEMDRIAKEFHSFAAGPKILITTEKDAARLGDAFISGPMSGLPWAVIGVRAVILNEPFAFEALIRTHVATHPTHR